MNTVHCILYYAHSSLYTVQCTHYTVHFTIQCTMYHGYCILQSILHCILYSVTIGMCCNIYPMQSTMWIIQYTFTYALCIMYTVNYTVYTYIFTLYNVHWELYTIHWDIYKVYCLRQYRKTLHCKLGTILCTLYCLCT